MTKRIHFWFQNNKASFLKKRMMFRNQKYISELYLQQLLFFHILAEQTNIATPMISTTI